MESPLNNTGASTLARKAAVISAVGQLAELDGCLSITITFQDTSGDYSVGLATLFSADSEMSLQLSNEQGRTSLTLRRSQSSER